MPPSDLSLGDTCSRGQMVRCHLGLYTHIHTRTHTHTEPEPKRAQPSATLKTDVTSRQEKPSADSIRTVRLSCTHLCSVLREILFSRITDTYKAPLSKKNQWETHPRIPAKGQPTIALAPMEKTATGMWPCNHPPIPVQVGIHTEILLTLTWAVKDVGTATMTLSPVNVMYIAKDDGKSAAHDMYIPEAKMRNVRVSRPTWFPNCLHTPLQVSLPMYPWFCTGEHGDIVRMSISLYFPGKLTDRNRFHTKNSKRPTNIAESRTAKSETEMSVFRAEHLTTKPHCICQETAKKNFSFRLFSVWTLSGSLRRKAHCSPCQH